MKKLFLVTEGDYSAYHLKGVFSTIEKAEKAKAIWGTGNDIEKFMLDEMPVSALPEGYFNWFVSMDRDGNTGGQYEVYRLDSSEDCRNETNFSWDKTRANFYVQARNKEHAVKIANERRIQMLANNQWPELKKEPAFPADKIPWFTSTHTSDTASTNLSEEIRLFNERAATEFKAKYDNA